MRDAADDPLGLGALTDDQLVEMARHVAAEIVRRDPAVEAVAQAAVLDEAEKLRAMRDGAAEAAARWRETERQRIFEQARDAERQRIIDEAEREIAARGHLLDAAERRQLEEDAVQTARLTAMRDERQKIISTAAAQVRAALAGIALIPEEERRKIAALASTQEEARMRDEERQRSAETARQKVRMRR